MKLNNTLIVTLPDFARHFNFAEFWEKRLQFVRDMHPQKVYYWNEELIKAYNIVAAWIVKGNDATDTERKAGCSALETLVGKPITIKDIANTGENTDITASIIRIQAGKTLNLPAYKRGEQKLSLRYHKIEVHGKNGLSATICIGKNLKKDIKCGAFVYVTEAEGCGFIEFLPTHLQNNIYELTAISQEGEFWSSLIVRNMYTMNQEEVSKVISFTLTDDGYVYINSDKKCIIMSNFVSGIKPMLMHTCDAFYVKSKGNDVAVLYTDGTLKSIHSIEGEKNIISAKFNENGKLSSLKR